MSDQNRESIAFEIEPPNPPNEGILFVDHAKAGRSGHLGHALVETAPGKVLAFYPNCSDVSGGHNGDGWMEVRRSEDGGRTWSQSEPLDYSKRVYDSGIGRSVMCEKAVRTDDGTLILFNLECVNIEEKRWQWQPLGVPTFLRSADHGVTWEPAKPVSDEPGRIWDALYHDDTIFVLELCNDSEIAWYGNLPEHHYSLYVSTDRGRTFSKRSELPFEIEYRGYGTMAILPDGSLIAYVYNQTDEKHLEYVVGADGGNTWSGVRTAYFAKQIRNPQMTPFKGGFVLHGRSGSMGEDAVKGHFVLYTSRDGINWDAGRYLRIRTAGSGAYSNNVLVHGPEAGSSPRLLIQASHAYTHDMTNVCHWWLE